MNKIKNFFLVKVLRSFYAHTPTWAKNLMVLVGLSLGSFITVVQKNPDLIPEQYQKYVPGACVGILLLLQTISVKKKDGTPDDCEEMASTISTASDQTHSYNADLNKN